MRRLLLLIFCGWLLPCPLARAAGSYKLVKVDTGVYAALVQSGSPSVSNAMVVVGDQNTIVAGAHFSRNSVNDLVASIASVTPNPIRYFILTHHHPGYTNVDFDFPVGKEVIMSWQTWKRLEQESREFSNPVLFFQEGLTLKLGSKTLIISNLNQGHAEGNLVVYLPESSVVYAGGLLSVGSVGWMGDAQMQNWVLGLEFIESLDAKRIIPGDGPVCSNTEVADYKTFLRAFLTEVLHHIEKGESLNQTLRRFKLPRYRHLKNFEDFKETNIRRAYQELKNLAGTKKD